LTTDPAGGRDPVGGRDPAGKIAIPAQIAASARALVDGTLQRVFARPYSIRNAADFERVMVEGGGAMSLASAGAIAALLARATPWIERMLPFVRRGASAGKVVPAAKVATYALPIALHLSNAIRHGVRELQVIQSYVMFLLEDEGIDADRDFVTALTLSLALDPDRPPDLSLTSGRATVGLLRKWILRSLARDSTSAVRDRARADLAAMGRLDLPALARAWSERGRGGRGELMP
jgi:hypothetical protein